VVGGDDDDGVLQQAALLQLGEHAHEVLVDVFDLVRVIEHVMAHGVIVRPIRGDARNVAEPLAALVDAHLKLVGAVWFGRTEPEAPRLILGGGVEEVREVGRVVIRADRLGGRRGGALSEGAAEHVSRFAVGGECHAG